MVFGIDVSNVNGTVNWDEVANRILGGTQFAHCKATEGGSFSDAAYTRNVSNARAAGLHVGAYHFARPDHHPGPVGARIEAQFFCAHIGHSVPGGWDIRPTLDLETGAGDLTAWAGAFLSEVERLTGVRPLLYTYSAFAASHLKLSALSRYGLWIADYGRNDGVDHGARLANVEHQFTSRGHINGVLGMVDRNSAPSLVPLLVAATPPPPPKPAPKPQRLWPVPVPAWFWTWAQWRRDGQTYARPEDAPAFIPPWAWVRLKAL